jgi:hypothetical protein
MRCQRAMVSVVISHVPHTSRRAKSCRPNPRGQSVGSSRKRVEQRLGVLQIIRPYDVERWVQAARLLQVGEGFSTCLLGGAAGEETPQGAIDLGVVNQADVARIDEHVLTVTHALGRLSDHQILSTMDREDRSARAEGAHYIVHQRAAAVRVVAIWIEYLAKALTDSH